MFYSIFFQYTNMALTSHFTTLASELYPAITVINQYSLILVTLCRSCFIVDLYTRNDV